MRKSVIAMLCTTSLLLQGCWTTQSKDNPQYADCSSYHDRGYEMKQDANYVTVVSASVGRCYGAEGAKIPQARDSAMGKCKSSNNLDCAVFAENKKNILSPTIKNREMDWDSTFALLSAGLAAGAVYEASKNTGSVDNGFVPAPMHVPLTVNSTSNANVGDLRNYSNAHPASSLPSAGAPLPSGAQSQASGKQYFKPVNEQCVDIDRSNSLADFFVNRCLYPVAVWHCVRDAGHSFQCGRGSGQLTHVSARDKATTLKARNHSIVACGNQSVTSAYSFSLEPSYNGQSNYQGRCFTR